MKTKDTPKQYVIYSRKSKFTGKGESIENQIELCRQYIAMHFGEEAAENVLVYEDEGFSSLSLKLRVLCSWSRLYSASACAYRGRSWQMQSSRTVSYTHLDVYKRQTVLRSGNCIDKTAVFLYNFNWP